MRFAILRHLTAAGDHYDLLFEVPEGGLRTWRCERLPDAGWQTAEALGRHRDVYLNYEGPVVGRGWVRQIERGRYRVAADRSGVFRVLVFSPCRTGLLEIEQDPTRDREVGWRCRMGH